MKVHQKLFWLLIFLLPTQVGRHFWPEWSYVLGLKIDYLSPTVYLTDILVVGILGLWGIENIKKCKVQTFVPSSGRGSAKCKITIKNLKRLIFPGAIFLFLLVNVLLAQNSGAALYKFVKIIEFALLGFYVAKNQYPVSSIQYLVSIAAIYSSLIAIAQFIRQGSIGGPLWWLGERTFNSFTPGIAKAVINGRLILRPYATFPHPNVLAGFILVSLILVGFRVKGSGFRRVLRWLAIILAIIAIIISFSRSAWLVGLAVFLLIFLRHFRGVLGAKVRLHLGGGKEPFLVSCFLLLIAVFVTVLLFKLPFSTEEAFVQRLQLIKVAINMIREQPLVGVGLNNFIPQLPFYWQNLGFTYWLQPVHNIFLLVAAEVGLVGLAAFLWFLILTFKKLLETGKSKLAIPLLVILLTGVADHYWLTLQQSQLLFTIILGLSWANKR